MCLQETGPQPGEATTSFDRPLCRCNRARALASGFQITSLNPFAPAITIDVFNEILGDGIASGDIRTLLVHLTDDAERGGPSCSPYGRSLLYLGSRAFETSARPILEWRSIWLVMSGIPPSVWLRCRARPIVRMTD
jgi:hypothetical protein